MGARSTKAGASTPATPRSLPSLTASRGALNEGRGLNPGDTRLTSGLGAHGGTLNEGRGLNPGDTSPTRRRGSSDTTLNEGRGLNPGDTRSHQGAMVDNQGRSTKAGASTPATRLLPNRHTVVDFVRSTKAGASTPATRSRRRRNGSCCPPLNEGRGLNPGDTGCYDDVFARVLAAQRRPGPQPRRHLDLCPV